jgi:hypothetical protein
VENNNNSIIVLPDHLFANAVRILSLEQQVFEAQQEHLGQLDELGKDYAFDMIEEKKFYHGKAILPEDNKLKR